MPRRPYERTTDEEQIKDLKAKLADMEQKYKAAMDRCDAALRSGADLAERIHDLETINDNLAVERDAAVSALRTANSTMGTEHARLSEGTEWREVNKPFHELLTASVDPARLAGLEVEVEGRVYLIGDVNPDGGLYGLNNLAFDRKAVVTRARVRVRR
jgi:hypothetical protein